MGQVLLHVRIGILDLVVKFMGPDIGSGQGRRGAYLYPLMACDHIFKHRLTGL